VRHSFKMFLTETFSAGINCDTLYSLLWSHCKSR